MKQLRLACANSSIALGQYRQISVFIHDSRFDKDINLGHFEAVEMIVLRPFELKNLFIRMNTAQFRRQT